MSSCLTLSFLACEITAATYYSMELGCTAVEKCKYEMKSCNKLPESTKLGQVRFRCSQKSVNFLNFYEYDFLDDSAKALSVKY